MSLSSLLLQFLTGLSSASSLFLVGAGLSLIFGVTRIVNFAHGSFFMVGIYVAYTLVEKLGGGLGFWPAVVIAALTVGVLGALIEMVLLRRIYKSPELFQLLATFALVLVIKDAVLYIWGPDELLGPRAPGLSGSVEILGRQFPTYDLFLIVVGPVVLGLMWLLLTRTRWGALQLPREPATLAMDLNTIGAAFVVVVVGGMGSIPGAYAAALLISEIKAVCIWLGVVEIFGYSVSFSKLTLVVDFVVMAVVLVWRPWGLFGRPQAPSRYVGMPEEPMRRASKGYLWLVAALGALLMAMPLLTADSPYTTVLLIDLLIAALFAASLHFIMGPAGMHSFGHAAYFGLGAYGSCAAGARERPADGSGADRGAAVAAIGAFVYGWFAVRLSGVYLAMLTLAFAQITWAIVYQWDSFTGGSNGLTGVWPSEWLSDKRAYYWLTLVLVAAGILMLRRVLFSPFGYALRAGRDSVLHADAIGIDVKRMQWTAFVIAGAAARLAGSLYAFSKGSISPESLSVDKSVDGLVMVLLGGIQTLAGPVVGAVTFSWLHDTVARNTDYWRATLGAIILILVLLFPQGIAGFAKQMTERLLRRKTPVAEVKEAKA